MRVLDGYIRRAVIASTLLTLLVLLALIGFITLIDELGEVGKGEYRTRDAFFYVLMIMPRSAYEVFPVAVLLGSLVSMGSMASHTELIAMRAAGVSLARIILSVLKAGVLVMLAVLVVGEVIAPKADQYAERMRAELISEQIMLKSRYGFWARDGNSFINIRKILPGSQLKNIYIYEFDDERQLKVSTYAAFASYKEDRWLLKGIEQTRFGADGVESRKIEQATWESMLSPSLIDVVVVRPTMLPAWGLYQYITFMRENGQEATSYEVALWGKLITPLMTLVMIFLSVPFVFGEVRSVGVGQRIFAGSLLGLTFLLLNRVFGHMAVVYGLDPLLSASIPGLVFLLLGLWFARRVH